MIPEREREALMRLTMCARGECPMCKYEEQCDNWDFRMELATKNMNILAEALRKTENSSEKPNNCEAKNYCDDCLYTDTCDSKEFFYACTSKPTISKMEQVDEPQKDCKKCKNYEKCKNNKWKCCIYQPIEDESQICDFCRYYNSNIPCGSTPSACKKADKFAEEFVEGLKKLKPKDEPQTDCAWR